MPSPVADSYSVASGQPVYAGRFLGGRLAGAVALTDSAAAGALGMNLSSLAGALQLADAAPAGTLGGFALPAWRTAMAANTWRAIPGNTLSNVDPEKNAAINPNGTASAPWHGSTGQAAIIDGWGGAAFDDALGRLWIPYGGGHSNYAGNEPYMIDLMADTPQWVMLRSPSGSIQNPVAVLNDGNEITGLYADGRIRSGHSYNNMTFIPGVGPIINRLGVMYSNGSQAPATAWVLNQTTGEATTVFDLATVPGQFGAPYGGCCYVPANGARPARVYGLGAGTNTSMEYANVGSVPGTWSASVFGPTNQHFVAYGSVTYIPKFDCIVAFDGQVAIWNLATGYQGYAPLAGTTPAFITSLAQTQPTWCDALQALLIWNNSSSPELIAVLTPGATALSAWTWSTITPAVANAVTPTVNTPQGTYGRFGYSAKLKGCYLINGVTQAVYFYATE